jgi:hypothetical protein
MLEKRRMGNRREMRIAGTIIGVNVLLIGLLLANMRVRLQNEMNALNRVYFEQLRSIRKLHTTYFAPTSALTNADFLELMRLRAEVTELRTRVAPHEEPPSPASVPERQVLEGEKQPQKSPEIARLPSSAWAFVGYDNPTNAFQSWAWSVKSGDLEAFLNSLTPEAQEQTQQRFQGMSRDEIAKFLKHEIASLKGLRFSEPKFTSDSEVTFTFAYSEADDGTTKTRQEGNISFVRTGSEWKAADGF